jgi:hypothetical protein
MLRGGSPSTQDLMTMFGGTAFAGRMPFERYFRDDRTGVVVGVANDQAYQIIAGILFRKIDVYLTAKTMEDTVESTSIVGPSLTKPVEGDVSLGRWSGGG